MESFTIHITYRGNIFQRFSNWLRLRSLKEITLPCQWNDLSATQFIQVAEVLFNTKSLDDAISTLFYKFTRLTFWQFHFIQLDDIYCLFRPCLTFVNEPINIEQPILKHISTPDGNMFGPKHNLQGISWKQFSLCETLIAEYTTTKNNKLLDSLCAILYCTSENPCWEDWSNGMKDAYQTKLENYYKCLPLALKQAAYLNYLGLKANLIANKHFENLYPESKPTGSNKKEAAPIDWHAITISLAGGKFGSLEELYYTSAFDVMKHIDLEILNKKNND